MPLTHENLPRTVEWQNFIEACEEKLPIEVREELWLAAHFKDLKNVRESGLYAKFEHEAEQQKNDPVWQLLKQHMDVALGVRLMDNSAISGILPYENGDCRQSCFDRQKTCNRRFKTRLSLHQRILAWRNFGSFRTDSEKILSAIAAPRLR